VLLQSGVVLLPLQYGQTSIHANLDAIAEYTVKNSMKQRLTRAPLARITDSSPPGERAHDAAIDRDLIIRKQAA
jgi:hypothetical protein